MPHDLQNLRAGGAATRSSKNYRVKELYWTYQGEGFHTGRAAVFCRFAGCNLWSGREVDRNKALCTFCDTDFVGTDGPGGGVFATAAALGTAIQAAWCEATRSSGATSPWVVFTGGEPALQLDAALVTACRARGFQVAVETNGTLPLPEVDWLTLSPKPGLPRVIKSANELKLVFPQAESELQPECFVAGAYQYRFLQPLDGANREHHTAKAADYCRQHPSWCLSLQTHKLLGIP